jgi:uncharacterized protein (DUF1800 family)
LTPGASGTCNETSFDDVIVMMPHLFKAAVQPLVWALGLAAASPVAAQGVRLANLSTRGAVGSGANVLISGLTVGPGSGDTLLFRAVGPGLGATFGFPGYLPDPAIMLVGANNSVISSTTGWSTSLAPVMASVGAFSLAPGSRDTAFEATLAPGSYSAVVTGASGDSGVVLSEIYEVAPGVTSSRLTNMSTRLQVGTGADIGVAGLSISQGSGNRYLLIRAVGPGLQSTFGLTGALADPSLVLADSAGNTVASNDDWGTPVGASAASASQLATTFAQVGAFSLAQGSKDSAVLVLLAPGNYTATVAGNGGTSGLALLEVYDVTPAGNPDVTITASQPAADTTGGNPGVFTISRVGDTSLPLVVSYSVGGTAAAGTDYAALSGVAIIPSGASTTTVTVSPNPNLSSVPSETVVLTLLAAPSYSIYGAASATVTITNVPATLYVATLRPPSGSSSPASGTATILVNPDGTLATVNVNFSDLTSAEVTNHLVLGTPGNSSNFVFGLPYGQVSGTQWTFAAAGASTPAALLSALKSGNIYIEIDSQDYPTGELLGQFIAMGASQVFTAPAAPPAIDLSNPSAGEAARFLQEASFGPKAADITSVMSLGYAQWITNQMALPATSHLAATRADAAAFPNSGTTPILPINRQAAWWLNSVTGADQLRQRVAFALSEIFVVSDAATSLSGQPEALANYYDMLANDAFGNFRQLIQDVTLSPVMGNYLNMLRNAAANPTKGTSADENYARELMQLFTIGLVYLNPDGTLQLDSTGQPIPTYTNATIVQTANVLTGWAYYSTGTNPSFNGATADWYDPMMLYPAYHDNTQKTIVPLKAGGPAVILPANEGGTADLKAELDTLFNHQNTGPMFCKELIQRLVKSNPSPGYVYRVAQVFANDGTGTRGNLAAVVKAILLDYEARSPSLIGTAGSGKLKEPILRQTALYRAFNASAQTGRFAITTSTANLGQMALSSPTVFNFFLPDYVPPGTLASAGLYGPEYQITTATTAISVPNVLYNAVYTSTTPSSTTIVLDLSSLTSVSGNTTQALISAMSQYFCGGAMSTQMQQQITAGLAALPTSAQPLDRARFALELTVTSPEGAIQQ